jgi:hypothetical protein
VFQVVEHLASKCKALNSTPRTGCWGEVGDPYLKDLLNAIDCIKIGQQFVVNTTIHRQL